MMIPNLMRSIRTVKKMTATRERAAGIRARIYTPSNGKRLMATWHRLGDAAELRSRVPVAVKLDRWSVALFFHDGRFRAIGNSCNHKGGPLAEGRVRGEFVMCPWHAWEYSVITGKGPEGYDEEQVPVFALEERPDGVYVQTPPVMPRKLVKHKPSHLLEEPAKPADALPRVLVICATAMDDVNPRFSTSDALLEHAVDQAKRRGAETRYIKLRDLTFFFFSSRRRHTRLQGDWSSDVCSSDLSWTRPRRLRPAIPRAPSRTSTRSRRSPHAVRSSAGAGPRRRG